MRSGLQKPGTVPFLALVLFSLLSLMPTLAKEWDLSLDFYSVHLAYHYLGLGLGLGGLGLPRYEGRYSSSRLRNASIDTRSRQAHAHPQRLTTNAPCKSWLLGDLYSSCVERDPISVPPHHSVMGPPPRSSFEAGEGEEAVTYAAPAPAAKEQQQSSMSLTRGVSAFREFVINIKRWDVDVDGDGDGDDQQQTLNTMQLQSAQAAAQHDFLDAAAVAVSTDVPTLAKAVTALPSGEGEGGQLGSEADTVGSDEDSILLFRVPVLLRETWQRVCHVGGRYLESLRSTTDFHKPLIHSPAPATNDEQTSSDTTETPQQPSKPPSLDSPPSHQDPLHHHIPSSNHPVSTAGQSTDAGHRRDSEHMRGSSMAIVIGLVVGIMWF
ncbi:hypothetical protein BJX68DRAFT_163104 [Aspergillus pseudodeflectus]|uniref:Uncharacterized protein n=1 Tax=Aspergillus pseudodeflectus TaxID=176178 RepID=A0ABR4L173_9EURO